MNFKNELLSLKDDGVVLLPRLISPIACNDCVQDLNELAFDHSLVSRSPYSTHIHNPFLFSENIRNLLNSPEIVNIYSAFFGEMYILRNFVASTISRSNQSSTAFDKPIGHSWHRDTPQFYTHDKVSVCLPAEITFQLVVALEKTNPINSTEFLLKTNNYSAVSSHRLPVEIDLPDQYISKKLTMEAGDIAIMDDNTFHRAGKPDNSNTRWLLFISFVPWYVRPYFLYNKINTFTQFERHIFGECVDLPDPFSRVKSSFKSLL